MPAPLSKDIRIRIIRAREQGDSYGKIAKELQVSVSAIRQLLRLYKETGRIDPRPLNNGRKPRINAETLASIGERIKQQPDISLRELIEEFSLSVSVPALCNTVNRKLGLRRKKNGARS